MAESIFGDKTTLPTAVALAAALKDNKPLWDQMLHLSGGQGEWKFYTKAAGWTYPVKLKKRTLFYLLPKDGWFRLTFVFGERAVLAAAAVALPEPVLMALQQARAYAEGRSVAMDIKSAADLDTFQKLLQLKLEN